MDEFPQEPQSIAIAQMDDNLFLSFQFSVLTPIDKAILAAELSLWIVTNFPAMVDGTEDLRRGE